MLLHYSYLNVCICGRFDPKYFLSGFQMQCYKVQRYQPTPGRPSSAQGLAASASPSCPVWATPTCMISFTFKFLSVELCSCWEVMSCFANKMLLMNLLLHWLWSGVDIRHQISRLWFTSLCSSFPSQINPSLLWSQSLKERRESQRVEKIDIFLVQHVPCKQTTFFLSNKCNNNSQNK